MTEQGIYTTSQDRLRDPCTCKHKDLRHDTQVNADSFDRVLDLQTFSWDLHGFTYNYTADVWFLNFAVSNSSLKWA